MPTRQERRRQERLAKKKLGYRQWADGKGKEKRYDMNIELIKMDSRLIMENILQDKLIQN